MAFDFKILGSSSSGNCSLLKTNHSKILIDAGFSGKRVVEMLEYLGEKIEAIDAIFFTHEHADHSMGLRGLSRYEHLTFFANADTAEALEKGLSRKIRWQIFETGSTFKYRDLEISAFSIPHDAYDPVGYIFSSEGRRLAWATDLGYLPALVQEKIRQAEVLVLESNYDPELLEEDLKRPWSIKQRIQGRHGHLSNQAAFEFLYKTEKPQWEEVYLAHLSKDCNSLEHVRKTFAPLLTKKTSYRLEIIDPRTSISSSGAQEASRGTYQLEPYALST